MHYIFNKIRFNKQLAHLIAKENKKKYNSYYARANNTNKFVSRSFSTSQQPNNNPFPSWQIIALFTSLGLYHQYLIYDDDHCNSRR